MTSSTYLSQAFHPLRPGLVSPVRVDPHGRSSPTRAQTRGGQWRRTSQGFYVPATVDGDVPEQRIVEAAVLLPSYGGVTGWAALRWMGAHWFDGLAHGGRSRVPVTLAVGGNVRPQPGVRICEEGLAPDDLTQLDGLRLTTAVRSVCFEMRYAASDRAAVVVLDMAAFFDLVSVEELWTYALAHSGWTGIPRCRRAAGLSVENAWSPREVLTRLVWELDAELPRPLCNVPIFDEDGHHIGTPDLFDPDTGVAGEYDGAVHLTGPKRSRDVRREERFRAHGLEYLTVLTDDHADPVGLVRRLRAAYDRAAGISPNRKRWTLARPSWWVDTTTVEARRALTDEQRRRLLRHRAG